LGWHRPPQPQPDLILLDLGLPDPDGMKLLTGVRSAGESTPIIVLTVRDYEDSKIAALDLGADDCISKPFCLAGFFARIRSALRHGVQARGSAPIVGAAMCASTLRSAA
jgi:two-component system KDP operon response regulator KdpE